MKNKHPGVSCLYKFIDAFNTAEKNNIITNLHFPHYVHSNGNEPVIYKNGEDFWKSLSVQLDTMIKVENWSFSTLDKCKIINKTDKTLINKKSYGSAKGIWISTFREGVWALQLRSMIPVSGTISSLAGTNMKYN